VTHTLHLGDCLDVLRTMPDCSVDAVVTDPPYGLAFMGKRWDYDVPSVEVWAECLRVLKPGGHLLAFAGTRTQHRMACRIEDAGFEIRDMIAWVYGSGFPKSLDVSKAIDKRGGSVAGFEQFRDAVRAAMKRSGVSRSQLQAALGNHMLSHYLSAGSQPAVPNLRDYRIIRDTVRLGSEFDVLFADEAEREVVGQGSSAISTRKDLQNGKGTVWGADSSTFDITAPATPEAQQWAGWGTALKPALEPITMARKPLVGTVAANVLEHGTGALNVDGCRVGTDDVLSFGSRELGDGIKYGKCKPTTNGLQHDAGRWPANLIHDGSEDVVGLFPQTRSGGILPHHKRTTSKGKHNIGSGVGNGPLHAPVNGEHFPADTGSAARFFYTAKATQAERQGVTHPTVKPLDLMAYLCRLITPPGGVVLDPFMGSGTTIKAAIGEGFQAIGIERDPAYFAMAEHRMNGVQLGLALTAA
jgi:DNA modification methylase